MGTNDWTLACPSCQRPLDVRESVAECSSEYLAFQKREGIWRMLTPRRKPQLKPFIQEYETIRASEGREHRDPAYFRALPHQDLSGRRPADWAIRAQSFDTFNNLLKKHASEPLKIVDCGAGNGWLTHQLSLQGHNVLSIDLMTNSWDGLGALRHYPIEPLAIQAEFERLPLMPRQADLVVFNASLHYAGDVYCSLHESLRILKPTGALVIIDTPFYKNREIGLQMVEERNARYLEEFGFVSNAQSSEWFLTQERLNHLSSRLGLEWTVHWPVPAWRRMVRRSKVALQGNRPSAEFPILWGIKT